MVTSGKGLYLSEPQSSSINFKNVSNTYLILIVGLLSEVIYKKCLYRLSSITIILLSFAMNIINNEDPQIINS